MGHLTSVIEDYRRDFLQGDQKVEAPAAEGPIDLLETMRREALEFAEQLPDMDVSSFADSRTVESPR